LPPHLALIQMKKHLAWYSTGLPGSAQMRSTIFEARAPDAVEEIFWRLWG
jgi:tRNA-dihydrouridine synthase